MDEVPLPYFFAPLVCPSRRKMGGHHCQGSRERTAEDPSEHIVIVNTGWHKYYGDNQLYYGYSPASTRSRRVVRRTQVQNVRSDTQALDHPLGTAIGPMVPVHRSASCRESRTIRTRDGRKVIEDFRVEPCHNAILSAGICGFENIAVTSTRSRKRVTFAAFPCVGRKATAASCASWPSRIQRQFQDRNRPFRVGRRMQITRFADARRYDAPKHFDMRSCGYRDRCERAKFAWSDCRISCRREARKWMRARSRKLRVLEGEVTIELADGASHSWPLDSCHIPGGEARSVRNDGNSVATMLVVMPHPGPRP